MTNAKDDKAPERLFPFVLRSKILIVGRESVARSKRKLQVVLITTDISDNSKQEVLQAFKDYPILQHYTAAELEQHFGVRNAKVVGFAKSDLAKSLYAELKAYRINMPSADMGSPAASTAGVGETKETARQTPAAAPPVTGKPKKKARHRPRKRRGK